MMIVCKQAVFKSCFRDALESCFPLGNEHAKFILGSLFQCRNLLAHHNPLSTRQAEQVVCYCGDIIDSLKAYYSMLNLDTEFNVPRIISVADSFGNLHHPNTTGLDHSITKVAQVLRVGDRAWFEAKVDPTFPVDGYAISWQIAQTFGRGPRFELLVSYSHVAEQAWLWCKVIASREYHRFGGSPGGWDDQYTVGLKILPALTIR